jgi:hypothetical protein
MRHWRTKEANAVRARVEQHIADRHLRQRRRSARGSLGRGGGLGLGVVALCGGGRIALSALGIRHVRLVGSGRRGRERVEHNAGAGVHDLIAHQRLRRGAVREPVLLGVRAHAPNVHVRGRRRLVSSIDRQSRHELGRNVGQRAQIVVDIAVGGRGGRGRQRGLKSLERLTPLVGLRVSDLEMKH